MIVHKLNRQIQYQDEWCLRINYWLKWFVYYTVISFRKWVSIILYWFMYVNKFMVRIVYLSFSSWLFDPLKDSIQSEWNSRIESCFEKFSHHFITTVQVILSVLDSSWSIQLNRTLIGIVHGTDDFSVNKL